MRVVIQRVSSASVTIDGQVKASIEKGLLILAGFESSDTPVEADRLAVKIPKLRIFSDSEGLMNLSNQDVNGDYLVVSQFTLHAATVKGNRPSYFRSARPEQAIPLYEHFIRALSLSTGKEIASGTFGADMQVALVNDGPVTICIDSLNWE